MLPDYQSIHYLLSSSHFSSPLPTKMIWSKPIWWATWVKCSCLTREIFLIVKCASVSSGKSWNKYVLTTKLKTLSPKILIFRGLRSVHWNQMQRFVHKCSQHHFSSPIMLTSIPILVKKSVTIFCDWGRFVEHWFEKDLYFCKTIVWSWFQFSTSDLTPATHVNIWSASKSINGIPNLPKSINSSHWTILATQLKHAPALQL